MLIKFGYSSNALLHGSSHLPSDIKLRLKWYEGRLEILKSKKLTKQVRFAIKMTEERLVIIRRLISESTPLLP